jgi:PAS domain S-box-containing protein
VWAFAFYGQVEDFLMVKKPTYEELEQKVKKLEKEIVERKYAEEKISQLSEIFNDLGPDPKNNIDIIVKRTCEILEGICSLYNRLDNEEKSLLAWSAHNLPSDFDPEDSPEGHICYEATIKGKDNPVILEDLEGTKYEETDPNVKKYLLKSYLGFPVSLTGKAIGSLCIVDVKKRGFTPAEIQIISTLAKAVSLEEERIWAEETLRESEGKYRDLVEKVTNVGILVAQDGKLVFINTAISDILGYTKDELTSHPNPFEFIHPDDRTMVLERHMKRLKGEEAPETYPYRIITRDGSMKWVEVIGVRFEWQGKPATLNFFTDISERKRAEDALRESEEKYRDLVENISDVIYSIDTDGVMTYISPAIESVLGYSPSEIIGTPFIEFIYKEDLPRTKKRFEEILSGHIKPSEYRIVDKFGEIHWILASSKPVFTQNHIIGIQGVLTDITERKQAEEALQEKDQKLERQAQHLEEVNTALKVLLEHREEEKKKSEENILTNVQKLIFPYIEKLENSQQDEKNQTNIDIIRSNLKDLISPFGNTLSSKYSILTSTEIQVADLIRHGRTSKEIASFLNVSQKAVSFHRGNIRRKLGLVNKKRNLISHLQSLAT